LAPKLSNQPGLNDTAKHRADEQAILRKQILILACILVAAALAWGIYSFGDDRGWGNADRAVHSKLDKAQQAFVDRRLDKAVRLYQSVLKRYPEHPLATQALTSLATAYEEQGRLDEAIQAYGQLLAKLGADKADLRAFTCLQVAKLQQEKHAYDQAAEGYQAVLKEFPKTDWAGEALQGLGKVKQDRGQYQEAIKAYEAVIKALPKGFLAAEAQGSIGECFEALSQTTKAVRAYQKVIDDYPSAVWDQAKARIEALSSAVPAPKAKAAKLR